MKKRSIAVRTTFLLLIFYLFGSHFIYAQTSFQLNGRNILKINQIYYDVTSGDSAKIEGNVLSIKFVEGLDEPSIKSILKEFPCSLLGKSPGEYYIVSLNAGTDYVAFVNSLNSNEYVSKTIFSYYLKYCTDMLNNDPLFEPG